MRANLAIGRLGRKVKLHRPAHPIPGVIKQRADISSTGHGEGSGRYVLFGWKRLFENVSRSHEHCVCESFLETAQIFNSTTRNYRSCGQRSQSASPKAVSCIVGRWMKGL